MTQIPSCPQRSEYEQFLLGKASAQEGERLLNHLHNCRSCNQSVEQLLNADVVVEALRNQQIEYQPGQATVTVANLVKRRASQAGGRAIPPPHEETLAMPAEAMRQAEVGQRTVSIDPLGQYSFLAPPQQEDELGRLAHYRILKLLGEGGMGMVFKAEDSQLERLVALKVMKPNVASESTFRERFLREAKVTAGLKNDHVVTIYQVGQERDVLFLAMEFLHGESLDQRLKRGGKRTLAEILRTAREMAVGLAAAHDKGLIHRDIKPANIWLETPPEAPLNDKNWGRVKLLDFGLARQNSDDRFLTQSGMVIGTPAYMAPEQAQGEKTSARTDLFSLGSVFYRMCSGELPFQGKTTMALLASLVTAPARPLREANPAVPEAVAELVMRLLAKKPEKRPASAREVVQAIQAMEKTLSVTAGQPAAGKAQKPEAGKHKPEAPPPAAVQEEESEETTELAVANPAEKEKPKKKRDLKTGSPALPKSRRSLLIAGIVALALVPLGWWLATVILRVETDKGTLVVEINDADVEARIKGGKLILTGADGKDRYTLGPGDRNEKIDAGRYKVRVEGADGLVLDTPEFTLKKDGKVTVRVTMEPKAAVKNGDLDRKAAEYVLSIGGVVRVNGQDQEIKAAAGLPREAFLLTSVNLGDNKQVSDAGLAAFKDCRNVTHLLLYNTPVSDAGLVHFKDCKNLRVLALNGPKLSDAGLAHFKDCGNLTELNLQGTSASDAGLVHFKDCKNLKVLILTGIPLSDAGLAHFKDCKDLTYLNLQGTPVSDAGLAHFKDCRDLTQLNLQATKVSDAGLVHIKECVNLRNLNLFGTTVSDAGLAHIKDFKNLTFLQLGKSKVTAAKIEELKKALPNCKIKSDGG